MSAETKAALDAAIAAHISDETGAVVIGYAMVVANQSIEQLDEEITGYFSEYGEGQAMHTSLGLVAHHHERLLHLCRRDWSE